MGRKRKRESKRDDRDDNNNNNNDNDNQPRKKTWEQTPRQNNLFATYYSQVGIVPEGEWEKFMEVLKVSLPTSFRISPTSPYFEIIQEKLLHYQQELTLTEIDGEKCEPPQLISWYPEKIAWQFSISRGPLRKSPTFQDFHKLILSTSDQGGLTRQESVSMVPPLLLDVEADHKVLDMCAAPGSKTSQIMDIMRSKAGKGVIPDGIVIANDIDEKRRYMLIHQLNRLASPCFMVTNHEAQAFPLIPLSPSLRSDLGVEEKFLMFDRILADVPCSGDGTLRKNYDLWARWNPTIGIGLHQVQLKIAYRGAQLLKVGARMVYSTCSFNPIEDEAVVAQLLRKCNGAMELVDVSHELEGLKRLNGISHWKVFDKDEKWYESHDDLPHPRKSRILPSCFPPSSDEAPSLHLDRCMRILPHHQNTGGFFVAVLKKTAHITDQPSSDKPSSTDTPLPTPSDAPSDNTTTINNNNNYNNNNNNKNNYNNKKKAKKERKEAPYYELTGERWESALQNIRGYYDIKDSFPFKQLFVRSEGSCPRIYLVSKSTQQIFEADRDTKRLSVISMGLRLFGSHSYNDALCPYRLNVEGLLSLYPFMNPTKIVQINLDEMKMLLIEKYPFFSSFSEEVLQRFQDLEIGGICLTVSIPQLSSPIVLSGWRGKVSSHLLLSVQEKSFLRYFFLTDAERETAVHNDKTDHKSGEGVVADDE